LTQVTWTQTCTHVNVNATWTAVAGENSRVTKPGPFSVVMGK